MATMPNGMTTGSADVQEHDEPCGCGFDKPWFGASYPDSYCVDGYLHDADGDGYDPSDATHPCPRCNTREYLADARSESLGTETLSWGTGAGMKTITGDDIWNIAKCWARQENPAEAEPIIAELEAEEGN